MEVGFGLVHPVGRVVRLLVGSGCIRVQRVVVVGGLPMCGFEEEVCGERWFVYGSLWGFGIRMCESCVDLG